MHFRIFIFIILSLILFVPQLAMGEVSQESIEKVLAAGITVDLREPIYKDGVLSTVKGGVITGPHLRIQAREIRYNRKIIDKEQTVTVYAAGDLLFEFRDYVFVGDSLSFDFQKGEGELINGRSVLEPWYFGGEKIELRSNGSIAIHHGYITTSENYHKEWEIHSDEAVITEERFLRASNVSFRFIKQPLFYLPVFKIDLKTIGDFPIRYRMRWGGGQGPRVGMIYQIYSTDRFKTFLRFDYRITRGPGIGIETQYISTDHKEKLFTKNYFARDSSFDDPSEKMRFRFEGIYHRSWDNDHTTLDLCYDKLSDKDMATDYYEQDLELKTAERTQLKIRRQQDQFWIGNFFTRVRLNSFETIKQELPTFSASFRPITIASTGIISENRTSASYLSLKYANANVQQPNFSSPRIETNHFLYRPFSSSIATFTPQIGGIAIFYGNSPSHDSQWLAIGMCGFDLTTHLQKTYNTKKHALEPYLSYTYYTHPTVPPTNKPTPLERKKSRSGSSSSRSDSSDSNSESSSDSEENCFSDSSFHNSDRKNNHGHYVFDINDGLYALNQLRFGCRNLIYVKRDGWKVMRYIYSDTYAYAFFHTRTMKKTIPKAYERLVWDLSPSLRWTFTGGWDFERSEVDHSNFRSDWTVNENLAIALEYRHRSSYAWRKANEFNFFLESFHSEKSLKKSAVSDRRNTFLFHFFYRFAPNWALDFESRNGWGRRNQPAYTEYEINLLTTIYTAWNVKMAFQHREHDNRVAVYLSIGLKKPKNCE